MIDTVEKIYETNDDGTLTNNFSNVYKVVFQNGITSFVPHDPDNTDYQEYIKWTKLSPANVAAPADE